MDLETFIDSLPHPAPMTPAQEREYIMDTEIHPQLARWGYRERFAETLDMPARQRETYEDMRRLIRGSSSIVALVGMRGVGKTAMTAQLAIEYAWRNYNSRMQEVGKPVRHTSFVYFKLGHLVERFKSLVSDYGDVETERKAAAFEYIASEHEIIVIDEMHDCQDMKAGRRLLTDLVDRRYAGLKHTIIISNQAPEAFAASAGDSIISRLNEHGAILECTWESFR